MVIAARDLMPSASGPSGEGSSPELIRHHQQRQLEPVACQGVLTCTPQTRSSRLGCSAALGDITLCSRRDKNLRPTYQWAAVTQYRCDTSKRKYLACMSHSWGPYFHFSAHGSLTLKHRSVGRTEEDMARQPGTNRAAEVRAWQVGCT